MADEKIVIDGKEYISSGRAAKLVGYTKDYVGQLARDGKVVAKRIGRNWYIEEASIAKHKVSVHYNLTKPKKPKLEKEVKEQEKKEKTDNSQHISHTQTQEVHEVENFLPPLRKKGRDVLLNSDIRYESETVNQEKRQNLDTPQRKINNNFYKEVPIRKPLNPEFKRYLGSSRPKISIKQRTEALHPSHLRSRPIQAVDGIIVSEDRNSKRSHVRATYTSSTQNSVVRNTNTSKPHYFDSELRESEIRNKLKNEERLNLEERSKVIPVVSSIILFTIVAVVYILFFSGT